jgi:uncharacterized protein YbjT (DUF2867 family)
MKVLLLGATGMVGQGVLRECLKDPRVEKVLTLGRMASFGMGGQTHPKLREIEWKDLFDLSGLEAELTGYDACFFCLGVSSNGLTPHEYNRLTYVLTVEIATFLARLNPGMTFTYVSGAGTDSTEKGLSMWAAVKGKTENALLALPFKAAYMFRPGVIRPLGGIKSKTRSYRMFYNAVGWLLPVLQRLAPDSMTTTEQMGKAMIAVAAHGAPKKILENKDINAL